MNADDTDLVVAHTSSGAEELKAPKAGVVSAFGTVPINDAGFDPIDAGPLRIARYIEPFTMLVGQLAYEGTRGPELAHRFEWRGKSANP